MVQASAGFQFLSDLDPVLTEIFHQNYAQLTPSLLGRVLGVRTSSKAKETHQRVGSFADPVLWDGQVAYGDAEPGYEVEWKHDHLTRGFKVERTLLEDMQYSGIFDQASALGQAFNRKIVKDEAYWFENAFDATKTGYDGKPLCSATHPRSKSDSTNTSNYLGALALTEGNLESAINQLEGLGDDLGEETGAMATILLGGRNNRKKIRQLTESTLTPESANNAINVDADLIGIVHPHISGNKWFVLDGPAAQRMLIWYWRLVAQFGSDDDTSTTLMRSYFGRMRYSHGWQDFRFVVGSNPA